MNFGHPYLSLSLISLTTVATTALASSTVFAPSLPPNPTFPASSFTVTERTQIPGKTLGKGTYTIRVLNQLNDRLILQLDEPKGGHVLFLALPQSDLLQPGASGPVFMKRGGSAEAALAGFGFSNGTLAAFVYPKEEAVVLAKANQQTVPAIDPASEGRPATSSLAPDDAKLVTLWLLSPIAVGPGNANPGIKAERYQVATSSDVPPAPRPRSKPAVSVLPHTASALPVIELIGFSALSLAFGMGLRRSWLVQ